MIKAIIENIKARIYAVPYDISREEITNYPPTEDWYYNGKLYYGDKWGVFFLSNHNIWFEKSPNNPINQKP